MCEFVLHQNMTCQKDIQLENQAFYRESKNPEKPIHFDG